MTITMQLKNSENLKFICELHTTVMQEINFSTETSTSF